MKKIILVKMGIILLITVLIASAFSVPVSKNLQVINFSTSPIFINNTWTITGGTYSFKSTVNIVNGGKLIVENSTLYFIQDALNPISLNVNSGGTLILRNSTLTVTPDQYAPSINFTLNSNGGSLLLYNSIIKYPGWLNVSNSKDVKIINSKFIGENSSQLGQLLKYGYPQSALPYVVYGPTPFFYNVTLLIKNSSFPSLFQSQKSVNSYSGTFPSTGTFPVTISSTSPSITTVSNAFKVTGFPSFITFYNCTVVLNISEGPGYSGDSQIYFNFYNLNNINNPVPIQFSQNPQNFTFNINFQNTYYIVNSTSLSKANNFLINITKPTSGSITVNYVKIILYTYKFNFIKQNFNILSSTVYASDLYISANSNNSNGNPFKNYLYANNSNVYILNWTTVDQNSYTYPPDPPYFVDFYSNIYLFRHLYVHVLNYNGVPLPGLNVNVTPNVYPSSNINNGVINSLNQILWQNLSIKVQNITDNNGNANYSLFSDWINYRFWPNALSAGDYNITISVNGNLLKLMNVMLPYFPHLNSTGALHLSVSVIVPDIIALSLKSEQKMIHYNTYSISLAATVLGESVFNVPVSFYLGNLNINNLRMNLIMNETNYLNFSYTVPDTIIPGNYTLKAIINPAHTIYESNYSNNMVSQSVEIYPSIDLAILNLSVSNLVLYANNYLNFTVKNYGLDNASNFTVKILIYGPGGFSYSKALYLNLNASATINESIVYVPEETGSYSFSVQIPYYWDYNQANNIAFISQNYGIDYYFITSGYMLVSNITPGSPMNIVLYSKIYVSGIVPSYAPGIMVSYVDLTNNINIGSVQSIYSGGYIYANLSTNYFLYGYTYRVSAILNPYHSIQETNYSNNYYNFTLYIPSVYGFGSGNLGPYMNGSIVPIYANITSGSSGINNMSIIFYFPTIGLMSSSVKSIGPNSKISIVYYLNTSRIDMMGKNELILPYEILITYSSIYPYYLIFSSGFINIFEKPNLALNAVMVKNSYVKDFSRVPLGDYFGMNITVENNGGWTAYGNSTIVVIDNGVQVFTKNITNAPPGRTYNIRFNVTGNSIGTHSLLIILNYNNITQKIPGPREISLNYTVIPPAVSIIMITPSQPPLAGKNFTLIFYAINLNATQQQGRNVYLNNFDVNVYIQNRIYPVHIGSNGFGILTIQLQESGDYTVIVSFQLGGSSYQQTMPVKLHVESAPFTLPFWLIIVIIALAVVGGLFGYAFMKYRKVEKNLMVCGNCGSLIPADSEKCPVCGVVFEKENVKCGNCGSWIKKDAKYCPVCGAIYMEKDDPDYARIEEMRKNYLEEIQKYKEEAKRDLGEKFTDEEFYKWWNTKPEFITFQDWMERKEEEKRPSVVCPVCGTLNPKGAKFCRVCGSPLPQEEEKK
ncbi:MAG: CARDB domain-containing protein [Thermoplasmata archaeon]|jgi:RNA polymerase subunit RPABC4/transcription elongation factor Spt4